MYMRMDHKVFHNKLVYLTILMVNEIYIPIYLQQIRIKMISVQPKMDMLAISLRMSIILLVKIQI